MNGVDGWRRVRAARFEGLEVAAVCVGLALGGATSGCASEPFRGPEGGVLTFDPGMLGDAAVPPDAWSADAWRPDAWTPPPDAYVVRPDVGPNARCAGFPTSCATWNENEARCAAQRGCSGRDRCIGTPRDCYFLSSGTCELQAGCSWYDGTCYGTARACGAFLLCDEQMGCRDGYLCYGEPTPCSSISVDDCTSQSGCYLTND